MGKHNYGLVFDAGSSGTRVYIYRWLKPDIAHAKAEHKHELQRLPEVETKKKWILKIHPGVSTFGDRPEAVGPDHLRQLVDFALEVVPKEEIATTPVFLLATAGVRLLPDHQRDALLQHICSYFRLNSGFLLPDCSLHIQVIPGETEGLYGWVAANYLLGGFDKPDMHDHGNGHHTYGFLDMGGASAQIAFAPNATETAKHAEDLKLLRLRRIDGEALEYQVFVTTWLGFGANEARKRFMERLVEAYGQIFEIPDPCLPSGISINATGSVIPTSSTPSLTQKPTFHGTGDFTQCLKATFPLLEKQVSCSNPPCLLNGIHTPAIDFGINHFVGVSEYWHTTHEIFAMAHKDKAYDFLTYQKQVTEFCSRKWEDIQHDVAKKTWGDKVDEKTVEEVCFKASWIINVLHDGIGIPRVGIEPVKGSGPTNQTKGVIEGAKDRGFLDAFQAVDKIDGTEVSWTLGKIVLYASSQMPSAAGGLAVGFGSNHPGTTVLPSDFQHAGGHYEALPAGSSFGHDLDADDDDDWHDKLFSGNYSRRIPGILIFLLILALAMYLLCGRERRQSLLQRLLIAFGRRPGTPRTRRRKAPGFSLGKRLGPAYERVYDESQLDDVELAEVSDDGSDSNHSSSHSSLDDLRSGLASGIATPAIPSIATNDLSLSRTPSRIAKGGYFDHLPPLGTTIPVASTPFERIGGAIKRSDSRDSLAPRSETARSRRASPVRRSSVMTPFTSRDSKNRD